MNNLFQVYNDSIVIVIVIEDLEEH